MGLPKKTMDADPGIAARRIARTHKIAETQGVTATRGDVGIAEARGVAASRSGANLRSRWGLSVVDLGPRSEGSI